jgi:uncharacterized membrane protein (UPF0182 family)
MSYQGGDRGDLGPLEGPFRFQREASPVIRRLAPWLIPLVTLVLLYVVLNIGKSIYADLLWFDSVGYSSVYTTRIKARVALFFAGGGLFLAVFAANVLLARRLASATDDPAFQPSPEIREIVAQLRLPFVQRLITLALIAFGALIAIGFATSAAGAWDSILLFRHGQSFGIQDPQFHRDLGFYVFKLPVYRSIVNWLTGVWVLTIIAVVAVYVFRAVLYGFRIDGPRPIAIELLRVDVPRSIKAHLSVLVALLLLTFVARYYLDRFDLLYSTRGVELGAFYTDIHASLPILYVLMSITGLIAVLVLVSTVRRGVALPIAGVAVWIVAALVGAQIYPAIIQNFIVQPNEASKEQQYLQRNIDMTRYAYNLDKIDEQQFPATLQATEQEVAANADTINNVRLWDPGTLRSALQQLQTIRPLFQFLDVDVDRYVIDGKSRQVMLSARELDANRLPVDAQTWVNSRLQFTHGYGYAVASVTQIQPDGSPQFVVSDIPLQGPLQTDRPEVYFGEQTDHHIIVDSSDPEFTPLGGDKNVETRFQGDGGVKLSNLFRKFVYAWEMGDRNILISGALNSNSRIIYRRNVQQRIHEIAPFLQLDSDPYLVVDKSGMYWMQDAYTTTDAIPYAHREGGVNYIRNSVKIVVNAYSGDTNFYATEPDEPLLKAYSEIFPTLFKPFDQMPEAIRAHVRYPEDQFRLQSEVYLRYHIRDALQFYQREDQWDIPTEGTSEQSVRPYYVIARLPGSTTEEFMLILPFVPRSRTNAIAWLAARSDPANYGELVAYRFPSSASVPGPTQVERRIDSDGRVSQQLTLWNQSGSTVIRGNLLMIPIGNANMFFEPLYLAAAGGANTIPQLKRVVVVNGDSIAMEPTMQRAIDVLFGRALPSGLDSSGAAPAPVGTPKATTPAAAGSPSATQQATPAATPAPVSGDTASLVAQGQQSYDRAQTLLRNGDFAGYGAEIAHLKQILDQLQQITGTPTAGA